MLMDVRQNIQFPSSKKFELYCKEVAVAVGYLSIKIFGVDNKIGNNYAYELGMAFQITNIVRDFKEDLINKRCYIPLEMLKKFGLRKDLKKLLSSPKIEFVLQEMLTIANKHFNKSDSLLERMDKKKIDWIRDNETFLQKFIGKCLKRKN